LTLGIVSVTIAIPDSETEIDWIEFPVDSKVFSLWDLSYGTVKS